MSLENIPSKKRDHPDDETTPNKDTANEAKAEIDGNGASTKDDNDTESWHTVDRNAKRRKTTDQTPKRSKNYPTLGHSNQARLNSPVKISDLQSLVLYLLTDGNHQQWISVQHRHDFKKVVVLMAPGLDMALFQQQQKNDSLITQNGSPDDYYPIKLESERLSESVRPMAEMFDHVWPIKTPGDFTHMRSPLAAMLSSPLPKPPGYKQTKKGPKPPIEAQHWTNQPTAVREFVATRAELLEHGFSIHPVHLSTDAERQVEKARRHKAFQSPDDGYIDIPAMPESDTEASMEPGDEESVLAVDCEMVTTTKDKFALARVSLVNWKGETVLDELIKPPDPVTDYLTQYSGITEKMLANVTLTLPQLQERLRGIITPTTILAGHSLESDLRALKIACPHIIDTSILYPHPKGPPTKSSLKWLCEKYLSKSIQNHGAKGHDSVEDALSCLALIKQKCQRGKLWGTSEATNESIFKRIARPLEISVKTKVDKLVEMSTQTQPGKTGAVVDWGEPTRGFGAAADVAIACENDEDVVSGVHKAVMGSDDKEDSGVDFVWGRLRELEAFRGWWNTSKTDDCRDRLARTLDGLGNDLDKAVAQTVSRIREVWSSLPERTAFIVYSGSGDPREMSRLLNVQAEFRRAFQTMKWDELPVRWTDVEETQLRGAVAKARSGIGFLAVTPPRA